MVVEANAHSPAGVDDKINPVTQDADELEALLCQVYREGARVALKQAINKLRSTALKAEASTMPTHTIKRKATIPMKPTQTKSTTNHGEVEVWKSIDKFCYSDSGYNEPTITVYIDLPGVSASKDRVKCNFSAHKFDLQIRNHNGVNYRMIKEPLEKDIVPNMCKTVVKKNQIKLKLRKKKGEYSYDSWTRLIAKGGKRKDIGDKEDPTKGLMNMMKDMYDEGDDATKKMIGEAMMKSRMGKVDPRNTEDALEDDNL